jgi:hypothetical protein
MCAQKTVLDCTDLVFRMSDFMLDSSAKEFFNSHSQYRGMIERFPGRYKKKKAGCLKKIEDLLEKYEGRIWHMSSKKTVIFMYMHIRGFSCNCVVSYEEGEVTIEIDQCMLHLLEGPEGPYKYDMSNYKHDTELVATFKNFFEC